MSISKEDSIKHIIQTHIPNATIYVEDPYQDGEHFEAIVISELFETKSLVEQHRMVMQPLRGAFAESVHALALKTFTPAKWETAKTQFNLPD